MIPHLPAHRLLALLIPLQLVNAQREQPPPPPPPAKLVVIALGPDPGEFYGETPKPIATPVPLTAPQAPGEGPPPGGGGLNMLPEILSPPEGALPPDQIYYRVRIPEEQASANANVEPEPPRQIRLRLNRSSSPYVMPSGVPISFFRLSANGEELPLFQTASLPPDGVLLIVLRPGGTGPQPWKDGLQAELLPMSSERLKGKELVVKNYAPTTVRFQMPGTEVEELAPGDWQAYDLEGGRKPVPVVAMTPGARKPFLYSSIQLPVNQLTFMAFYAANPETNRGHTTGFMKTVIPRTQDAETAPLSVP